MASVSTDKNGNRRVLFTNRDRQRKTVYLGAITKKEADAVCAKIEGLNTAKIAGTDPADEVVRWLFSRGDDLRQKLVNVGLAEPKIKPDAPKLKTLIGFVDECIAGSHDKGERTLILYRRCRKVLLEYFGSDKTLVELTPHDADRFASWLRGKKKTISGNPLAENTVRGELKNAKMFCRQAVRAKHIASSPFTGISSKLVKRPDRMEFVDHDTIEEVLNACLSTRWKAIVVLCRYAGLRCPSEVLSLRWSDINFDRGRMRVRSPKGENFGKGIRRMPLFPEVRRVLDELYLEPDGGEFVIASNDRSSDKNLRTGFLKILKRAGVEPWQRLFQNLRSSRETELLKVWPLHVVVEWLGNTEKVASENYLQVRDEDFELAATTTTRIPTQSASVSHSSASQSIATENDKPLVSQGNPTKQGVARYPREVSNL